MVRILSTKYLLPCPAPLLLVKCLFQGIKTLRSCHCMVPLAAAVKTAVFWDLTPCSLVAYLCCTGTTNEGSRHSWSVGTLAKCPHGVTYQKLRVFTVAKGCNLFVFFSDPTKIARISCLRAKNASGGVTNFWIILLAGYYCCAPDGIEIELWQPADYNTVDTPLVQISSFELCVVVVVVFFFCL